MKKFCIFILTIIICLCMFACGEDKSKQTSEIEQPMSTETLAPEIPIVTEAPQESSIEPITESPTETPEPTPTVDPDEPVG